MKLGMLYIITCLMESGSCGDNRKREVDIVVVESAVRDGWEEGDTRTPSSL